MCIHSALDCFFKWLENNDYENNLGQVAVFRTKDKTKPEVLTFRMTLVSPNKVVPYFHAGGPDGGQTTYRQIYTGGPPPLFGETKYILDHKSQRSGCPGGTIIFVATDKRSKFLLERHTLIACGGG